MNNNKPGTLTVESALRLCAEVHDLEMERVALMGDSSDEADKRINEIGKRIEEVVVQLVRDTEGELHKTVMAKLDEDEIETSHFAEYLGPVKSSAAWEDTDELV